MVIQKVLGLEEECSLLQLITFTKFKRWKLWSGMKQPAEKEDIVFTRSRKTLMSTLFKLQMFYHLFLRLRIYYHHEIYCILYIEKRISNNPLKDPSFWLAISPSPFYWGIPTSVIRKQKMLEALQNQPQGIHS